VLAVKERVERARVRQFDLGIEEIFAVSFSDIYSCALHGEPPLDRLNRVITVTDKLTGWGRMGPHDRRSVRAPVHHQAAEEGRQGVPQAGECPPPSPLPVIGA
jgi:hypothetical protein